MSGDSNHSPYVSIIIPAFNEAKNIGRCLTSLKNLNFESERYEIIVVDNGSTDETVQIAKKFTDKVYVVPQVHVPALRNYGTKMAKGNIYAFIDSDCIAREDWLQNALQHLERQPCVTGSRCHIPLNPTWVEKAWFSQKSDGTYETVSLDAANMLLSADLFKKIGGFNETLASGEDYELCMRAKQVAKIISDDDVHVIHLSYPKTLKEFLKRQVWHGLGAFGSLKHSWYDKPLIGTVCFFFLTVLQVLGAGKLIIEEGQGLFVYSTIGLMGLLFVTVLYRMRYISGLSQFFQLLALYYLYYVGRSVSFFYILFRRKYVRRK